MNWKKTLVAVPLSLSILVPTAAPGVVNAAETSQPTVDTAASDLRATLGTLLSEHANLAIITMRKGIEGSKDFEEAAAALKANTEDLSNAIASVYGEKAGEAFKKMWSEHIGYFVDYVMGTAKNNKEKKQQALEELSQYRKDFSQFLEKATEGRVGADALAQGLQEHVNQLINAFNAYVDGNYEKAFSIQADARSHMFMTAKGLSSAIVDQFQENFNDTMAVTPAANLRATLNNLLSGHVAFAVTAMQNGIEGKDSVKIFKANAAQLAENTDKLANAIASVYGEKAGSKFKEMWSNHIGYFVDYVKATAAEDKEAKQEALDKLKQYREDFSQFISTATEGKVKAEALSAGLQKHVNQLITAFNAYHNGNYEKAYITFDKAYKHMKMTAKSLSGAIVQQHPNKFTMTTPEMPNTGTGMGGAADDNGVETFAMTLAAMILLTAGGAFVYRKKSTTDAEQ